MSRRTNQAQRQLNGQLNGKVIAVTGGARGIGAATARALAKQGARVVIGDLDLDVARSEAMAYDGLALRLDVANQVSFSAFLDAVIVEHGRIDGLVNNAGFMVLGRVQEVSLERQLAQIDVNLRGVIYGCAEAGRRMDSGGTLVNIASLAGRIPMPGAAVYSATKAAVLAFSEALDAELSGSGIRVAAVLPTFTNTELIAGAEVSGLSKPIEPEDVARVVADLFARYKGTASVPPGLALGGASWAMLHRRMKPWLRTKFGLETIFTEPDLAKRSTYDRRVASSAFPDDADDGR